jgi:hypothetical protein
MSYEIKVNVDDEKITLDMPYRAGIAFKIVGVVLFCVSLMLPFLFLGVSLNSNFEQPLGYRGAIGGFLAYLGFLLLLGLSYFIGTERVEINRSGIYIEHRTVQIPLFRHWFEKKRIQGLFISKVFDQIDWPRTEYQQFKTGRIGFNIEKTFWGQINTIRFGSALNEDRAREILALIFERFPEYRPGQVKFHQIQ